MEPISTTIASTIAVIEMLTKIKQVFYDDSKINKLKSNIEEQAQQNKDIIKGLIEQVESSKEVIEKHNDVLLSLSQAIQETEKKSKKIRILSYSAIIVSLVSVAICVLLAFK